VDSSKDGDVLVLGEQLPDLAALLPAGAAMDRHHRVVPADQGPDPLHQIRQHVPVLGENDDLTDIPGRVLDRVVIGQQRPAARSTWCPPRPLDPPGESFQTLELGDLDVQLRRGPGGGRGVGDVLLQFLQFVAGQFLQRLIQPMVAAAELRAEQLGQPLLNTGRGARPPVAVSSCRVRSKRMRGPSTARSPPDWTPTGAAR